VRLYADENIEEEAVEYLRGDVIVFLSSVKCGESSRV
jgi:hypothetical protein